MRSAIAVTDARNVRLSAKNAVNSVKTALMAVSVKIAASVLTVSAATEITVLPAINAKIVWTRFAPPAVKDVRSVPSFVRIAMKSVCTVQTIRSARYAASVLTVSAGMAIIV